LLLNVCCRPVCTRVARHLAFDRDVFSVRHYLRCDSPHRLGHTGQSTFRV
jgi:hypothetical protein